MLKFFAEKMWVAFAVRAKATHIFSAKNIRILYIVSAKTVNEMTLNELVKLTTLCTNGPWLPVGGGGSHMSYMRGEDTPDTDASVSDGLVSMYTHYLKTFKLPTFDFFDQPFVSVRNVTFGVFRKYC